MGPMVTSMRRLWVFTGGLRLHGFVFPLPILLPSLFFTARQTMVVMERYRHRLQRYQFLQPRCWPVLRLARPILPRDTSRLHSASVGIPHVNESPSPRTGNWWRSGQVSILFGAKGALLGRKRRNLPALRDKEAWYIMWPHRHQRRLGDGKLFVS